MTTAPAARPRRASASLRIYLLWAILALPGVALVLHDVVQPTRGPYIYWSGFGSCGLLIATLAVTPLAQLFGPRAWVQWLRTNRRYLGVASFGYALLHLAFYVKSTHLSAFLSTFVRLEMVTGWIGFAILLAMAVTSIDRAVLRMGHGWKRLQRWVYPAAVLILLHWVLSGDGYVDAVVFTLPLAALTVWRLLRR